MAQASREVLAEWVRLLRHYTYLNELDSFIVRFRGSAAVSTVRWPGQFSQWRCRVEAELLP